VAEATGGTLIGAAPELALDGVATDTRRPMAGACFVALRGPRHDAHDHLAAARAAGASLALVDRDTGDLPRVRVDDTRAALGRLAAAWRRALGLPVIAITGSVGKTTSKELLRSILAARGSVAAAPSSWNNDVGLPLTLLSARPEHDALVAEIGTGGPGEIRALSEIARPDLAIITAVGHAHLGAFGSIGAIATEKASIVAPMEAGAPVVANRDAPHLTERLAGRSGVVWYGRDAAADVRLLDSGIDADGPWCAVDRGRGRERFTLQLTGEHNALNACGAIAAVGALAAVGPAVDDAALRRGLADAAPPSMRLTVRTIGGVHVHDDSWNASPESMAASLRTFDASTRAAMTAGGRRVLVLGDMLELGPDAPRLHREVGQLVQELDLAAPFAALILVGRHAPLIGAGRDLAARATLLERLDGDADVRRRVLAVLRPDDHVLLKGSRGIGLERVATWLDEAAGAAAAPGPATTEGG
jgi:UDP-N-acetylmuramoyl-tripeptide--D-alanyl-D-alanine ligase